jgi:hypothetical protein
MRLCCGWSARRTKGYGGSADFTLGYNLYTANAVYYAATRHSLRDGKRGCATRKGCKTKQNNQKIFVSFVGFVPYVST